MSIGLKGIENRPLQVSRNLIIQTALSDSAFRLFLYLYAKAEENIDLDNQMICKDLSWNKNKVTFHIQELQTMGMLRFKKEYDGNFLIQENMILEELESE
ncbi:MAG: hypothetical protein OIF32_08330 [Campylobacterales bacterium]|nr:hypothetical protein [Campylobacterales bacterium]